MIDLLLDTPEGLVVIDYKTGAQSPTHAEQLKLYATLLGVPEAEQLNIVEQRLHRQGEHPVSDIDRDRNAVFSVEGSLASTLF